MIAGVDGCPGGWYVVTEDDGVLAGHVVPSFASVLALVPGIIAVDVPIGLADTGARSCDLEARRYLGAPRASSVFPAPLRSVLGFGSPAEASRRRFAADGKGMSRQAFGILRKVAEVDALLVVRPGEAERVREVHPEVSFAALNGGVGLLHKMKGTIGRAERLSLLQQDFGDAPQRLIDLRPRPWMHVAQDDVVDAFAALWTARRLASGLAWTFPAEPARDERGLTAAIHV